MRLAEVNQQIGPDTTTGPALRWWQKLIAGNNGRLAGVLRLAEELLSRRATVEDFHRVCARSGTSDVQANLHYFDYIRAKRQDRRRRDAAQGVD